MNTQVNLPEEEKVKSDLIAKFSIPEEKIRVARKRRIFADIDADRFHEIFEYAINDLKFVILCTITGLDEGETMGFIYHIARENGIILNLHIHMPKDKFVLKSISARFPAADIYEREMIDLLGIKVTGLKQGARYPLPDNWPAGQYPLRKDWKTEMLKEKEAKNGTA